MTDLHRILLILGNEEIGELIRNSLAEQTVFECTLETAGTLKEGLALLSRHTFDTILLDLELPYTEAEKILKKIHNLTTQCAIIVLTPGDNTDEGIKLMKLGAHNYLPKDKPDSRRLVRSILFSHEMMRLNKAFYISQERSIKIFNECPLGIAYVNMKSQFIDVNDVFCRMMGYPEKEMLELTFKDITHKDHLSTDIESIQKLVKREIPVYKTEKRYIRKDKRIIWGRLHVSVISDNNDQFVHMLAMVEDITERKEAEENLRRTEEKFRNLFENSSVGISLTGVDGTLHINKAFSEITGYSEEELKGKKWTDISHPDEIEMTNVLANSLLEGKSDSFRIRKRYLHKNGGIVWVDMSTSIQRGQNNEPLFFITIINNISEQARVEEKLAKSETALRAILDASTESVLLIDLEGRVIAANETTASRLDVKMEDLIGRSVYDLIPPELAESRRKKIDEAISGYKVLTFTDRRKDIWMENVIYPVKQEGKFIGAAIFATDITRRKMIEEAMVSRETLLMAILESSGSGILVVDNEGKVTHSNSYFAKMWGIHHELLEKGDDSSLLAFVLDQLIEPRQFIDKVKSLYKTAQIDSDDLHFKDGRIFERLSYPLVVEEKIKGRVWSFRDVTRLKNAENELQRVNQDLTDLNAAKDKFFSIIAHDLRSPFNVLLGLSRIMADPEENLSLEDTRKFAAKIHSTLTSQFELLQNLLEWARMQLGKVDYHPDIVNVHQIVSNVTGLLSGSILRKNIVFENNLDEELDAYVDPNVLLSVLNNVISNAIKFTRSSGRITLGGHRTNNHLELVIHDNGVGMNKKKIDQIFRLDSVISTKGTDGEKGTGLGLILCKELLEKQGGSMRITSEENIGTTVTIILPYGNTVTRTDR